MKKQQKKMEKEAKQYNENRKNNGKTLTTTIKKILTNNK